MGFLRVVMVQIQEREAADKLFKGKQGEQLRQQVVKHSAEVAIDGEDLMEVSGRARMMVKARSAQEQEKIKVCFG